MRPFVRSLCFVAVSLYFGPVAIADTLVTYESSGASAASIAVKGDLVRWETTGSGRDAHSMLYDNKKKKMSFVDLENKQIHEMDETTFAKLRAMRAEMQPMMEQMRRQLKNMPPEQRRMMEKQMPQLQAMQGGGKSTVTARRGKKTRIKGYPCQVVDMLFNGKALHQMCVAEPAAVGISRGDYQTMLGMFEFMDKMAQASPMAPKRFGAMLKGVPVQMKDLGTGKVQTVKSVSNGNLSNETFKLPPYKRVDPMARPPRMR
jgi:translation elongation factor P/translation initiation factor 5A